MKATEMVEAAMAEVSATFARNHPDTAVMLRPGPSGRIELRHMPVSTLRGPLQERILGRGLMHYQRPILVDVGGYWQLVAFTLKGAS